MLQKLFIDWFELVEISKFTIKFIRGYDDDSDIGYFLGDNMEYPVP